MPGRPHVDRERSGSQVKKRAGAAYRGRSASRNSRGNDKGENGSAILVVEDDRLLREFVCDVLKDRGFRVLSAARDHEALEVCRQVEGPIPLVIADVVLPGRSGPDTVAELKKNRPEMEALFMTGYSKETLLGHGLLDRNAPLLEKPFGPTELLRAVGQALAARIPTQRSERGKTAPAS